MKLAQGDIWFAQFGAPAGREQGYDRPAMILSNDRLNRSKLGLVFAVPLTTRERGYLTHVRVGCDGTGLTKTSWAMVEQVRAISPDRFDFFIGNASEEIVAEAVAMLRRML
ncbi:type II toxin-antitoxin system PemK/MazF family toxin [Nonomuraea sp. 3-1Str]|uniref:type II toxin-antitoxin system PemK/MazF family toxin n=1 Tax=Nonomuraea sp. 3-1Str TaxID=2929801 RepID=UPI002859926C|nr:type II toxin-antitoxin system PemK/MazF family toxin [Nonomuraea sp. 3-1Str]MDR8410997.1 type II toxin-antitoxin system PemK/MazF family toxin [Nonomuraea sp. 3-1Str]